MDLGSLFRRRRTVEPEPDTVLVSTDAKLAALAAAAGSAANEGAVLILAHFAATARQLEPVTRELGATDAGSEVRLSAVTANPGRGSIAMGRARDLVPLTVPSAPGDERRLTVLVAERYPLRERDEAIGAALHGLPWTVRLQFFLSFDDPLMARFVGDGVRQLLTALGLDPDEGISHPTVSKAIANAQKKIAKQASMDLEADSAEDWLARL